jgi:hypothetical protein
MASGVDMSVGFKRHDHGSGYDSPTELVDAEDMLDGEVKVDQDHDVPFCAGMSTDGKTMYVDHSIDLKRGVIDRTKPTMVHEVVEFLLITYFKMKYLEAHNLAIAAEQACVRAQGIPDHTYNKLWDEDIRRVGSRGKYTNIPKDLQTQQYQQEGTKEEKSDMGLIGGGKASGPHYATMRYGG